METSLSSLATAPRRTRTTNCIGCITAVIAALGLGACGGDPRGHHRAHRPGQDEAAATDAAPITGTAKLKLNDMDVHDVPITCTQGAQEDCNGVDDNCDGQIDEGCGYANGPLQITMAWNTQADIDLFVTDPTGETISNQHRRSASGGELDHDARGGCRTTDKPNQIENAVWKARPPKGTYQVGVHYWGECSDGGTTTVSVTVSAFGKVLSTSNTTVEPGERRSMLSVSVE
ncbi:MAG: DUF2135 domain-containing protein [Polyangiales bacterium]|nr:DUF2135 domain-containing protein [Myxococcales bacterium]